VPPPRTIEQTRHEKANIMTNDPHPEPTTISSMTQETVRALGKGWTGGIGPYATYGTMEGNGVATLRLYVTEDEGLCLGWHAYEPYPVPVQLPGEPQDADEVRAAAETIARLVHDTYGPPLPGAEDTFPALAIARRVANLLGHGWHAEFYSAAPEGTTALVIPPERNGTKPEPPSIFLNRDSDELSLCGPQQELPLGRLRPQALDEHAAAIARLIPDLL
jgi:hypothetical protein